MVGWWDVAEVAAAAAATAAAAGGWTRGRWRGAGALEISRAA
eukprot:COSAG02_NODE_41238_length_396_cov_1.855219_1_plen_41_part_01